MRRPILPIMIVSAVLMAPMPTQAKVPWVKKAQGLGLAEIKNCDACHTAKPPALNDLGKWLMDEKTKRKASEIDLMWIKDYKKP